MVFLSLLKRTLIPSWGVILMTSSKTNHLPKFSLPNAITLEGKASSYEFQTESLSRTMQCMWLLRFFVSSNLTHYLCFFCSHNSDWWNRLDQLSCRMSHSLHVLDSFLKVPVWFTSISQLGKVQKPLITCYSDPHALTDASSEWQPILRVQLPLLLCHLQTPRME